MEHLSNHSKEIYNSFLFGREKKTIQLLIENETYNSKNLIFEDNNIVSFNSNNYLDFQDDVRVKRAAIEYIEKYGIHSSIPRTFISFKHFEEAEEKLEQIFGLPTFLCNTTSLGHFSYLPLILDKRDIIILDQFVHKSVQIVAQYLKSDGVEMEFIKHNNMNRLEERIKELSSKYRKVWYLCDGIYSMHGDGAPFNEIHYLLNKYENFCCYVDDAHGMSWIGKNGKGYVFHNIDKHERLFVITSLNKAFGSYCSAMVFPNNDYKNLVRTIGSSIVFSTSSPHFAIGATTKIAEIHLTEEIYEKQILLKQRIDYFLKKAVELDIPLANYSETPIFLVGGGSLENTLEIAGHIIKNGYIAGIAAYPSVPQKCSGLRVNVNINHTTSDIDNILLLINEKMKFLELTGKFNRDKVRIAFNTQNTSIFKSEFF